MDSVEERKTILEGNDFAQLIDVIDSASAICDSLTLDAGHLIKWENESQDALYFYNMLEGAITILSGLVLDVWELYCKYAYYNKDLQEAEEKAGEYEKEAGPDGAKEYREKLNAFRQDIEEMKQERLDCLEDDKEELAALETRYTIKRAAIPSLNDKSTKTIFYNPKSED